MDLAPHSRILVALALGIGTLVWSGIAVALSNPVAPLSVEDTSAGSSTGSQATVAQGEGNLPETADSPSASELLTLDRVSPAVVPCLQGLSVDRTGVKETTGDPCAESVPDRRRFSLEFGQQLQGENGILGRVSGLRVGYELAGGITLNGIAGFPGASGEEPLDPDKRVFGLSAAKTRFDGSWDLRSYLIEEQDGSRTAYRTLGGVLRNLTPERSMLIALDYDAIEHSLSTFVISGLWKPLQKITVRATFDVSKSHGHQGPEEDFLRQTLASRDGWGWILPVDRVSSLSQNDSTEVTSVGFGLSHVLSPQVRLDGDVAMLDVSQDALSSGEAAGPLDSKEYFYHLALSIEDLVLPGDSSALAVQHSASETSRTSSATLDTHYAIGRRWQLNPRLQTDYRDGSLESSAYWSLSPAVKMEFRWREDSGIEIEAGGEWSNENRPFDNNREASYFLTVGYRAGF